jgi:prephenate dehydrogenase
MNPEAQPNDLTPLQGLESARADLFEDALYAVCPSAKTPPAAVKRVTDMVYLLKGRPFFLDSVEHDGMRAAVDGLPAMISLALMQNVGGSSSWREARKLAGHIFGMATASLGGDAAAEREQLMLNAEHLVPRLDEMLHELKRLREWILSDNNAELEKAFEQATSLHARWLADRAAGKWEEPISDTSSVTAMGTLGGMLGFGSRQRRRKDD